MKKRTQYTALAAIVIPRVNNVREGECLTLNRAV